MDKQAAMRLWNDSTCREKGIDHDGNESNQMTGLGGAALALGVPTSTWAGYTSSLEDQIKIAQFLRVWADAMEDKKEKE